MMDSSSLTIEKLEPRPLLSIKNAITGECVFHVKQLRDYAAWEDSVGRLYPMCCGWEVIE